MHLMVYNTCASSVNKNMKSIKVKKKITAATNFQGKVLL